MQDLIVSKYGGSSITNLNDIERIRKITQDDQKRKIIVVSAPGKKENNDDKVTDLLINFAKNKKNHILEKIIGKYFEIYGKKGEELTFNLINETLTINLEYIKLLDAVKSIGEKANALLLADYLNYEYIDPKELFLVTENFGNAKILPESEDMIKKRLDNDKIYVIPGFYGYTKKGDIATFSRGGSDLTAAYIASSLDSLVYENFTDQDGILSANPEIVDNPKKIKEITYKEMRDLSYIGFNIFNQEALLPLVKKRVLVHVRNTFNYPSQGTYILNERISDSEKPIIGVAYKDDFCAFNIDKFGLNDEIGVAEEILNVFSKNKLSIEFPLAQIDDFSVILRQEQLKKNNFLGRITNQLYDVLGNSGEVNFHDNLACISVAGKGLRDNKKIDLEIQNIFYDNKIDIEFIPKSKGRCLIYCVNSNDGKKAANLIYDKFLR